MAAASRSRRRPAAEYEYGMDGDAARQLSKREPDRRRQEIKRRDLNHTVTVRRNQERALQMNLPYVMMLTAAAICALYICVSYLQIQSSITARLKNIQRLEETVESLREENNALETRINTSVDLDSVYKIATEELGMVYANREQVRLYNKTESEYVRQYEDIPER